MLTSTETASGDADQQESVQLVGDVLKRDIRALTQARYASIVAAACMVLYGYDASVYNSVQGSKNWVAYFDHPSPNMVGLINTAYTVGAIFGGFFMGGPIADYFGRKVGMGVGCAFVIVATFIQCFAPRHSIGTFLGGRVVVGIGQGVALVAGPIYVRSETQLE